MDFTETDERRALRETVSAIASSFGHAYFAEKAAAGQFPDELWTELVRGGFAGVNIDAEFGGGGGQLSDLVIVAQELAKAGCPLMTLVVSPGVCGPILATFGTAEQKQRWLTGIGSGQARMAFALTEPTAGTNTGNINTRADRVADGWRLNGEKHFISGVEDSRAIIVAARTGRDIESGRARLSLFVVESEWPGVTYSPIRTQVFAAERQSSLSLTDVDLPASALVGTEGEGFAQLFVGLNPERIMSAATCLGIAQYALDKAVSYAGSRSVWGVPIGAHQGIAHPLARAFVGVEGARLLMERAATMHDAGMQSGVAANMAKLAAAEAAAAALDVAIQTHGGNGLSVEYGLADLWGLTRLYRIAPVSDEMTLNHIASHGLGLPRSY